ncbi:MAG: N-methyl-L-tryptophan oxidase [bacterium]|nr:N-methyl-L-tryptophan oxidase [bacterium]
MKPKVIVIGVGGMGSSACYYLAKQGVEVTGIEQFNIAHDKGSSHGQTRLIRQAYFEHPDYVPLLKRAYTLWHEMEQEAGDTFFRRVGLVMYGKTGQSQVLKDCRESAGLYGIPIETITPEDKRFPCYPIPDDLEGVLEPGAGYLEVERAVTAYADLAKKEGAVLLQNEKVISWQADSSSVTVQTDKNTYHADKLVITAGAWAGDVLKDLGLPLEVHRLLLFWFPAPETYHLDNGAPCFGYDLGPNRFFYGFPMVDGRGLKTAHHFPNDPVADPDQINREYKDGDAEPIKDFISRFLTDVTPQFTDHAVCMYTMTPDDHFIIDLHPNHNNVVFAAGFSGHGFKFAPVIGETLAQYALEGKTPNPVGFLKFSRFK